MQVPCGTDSADSGVTINPVAPSQDKDANAILHHHVGEVGLVQRHSGWRVEGHDALSLDGRAQGGTEDFSRAFALAIVQGQLAGLE